MPLSSEQFHTLYDGAAQPVVLVQDGTVAALNSRAQELFTVGTALCAYLPQDAEPGAHQLPFPDQSGGGHGGY